MTIGSMEPVSGIVRTDPELEGGELEVLTQFLDYHRATLRMKCSGLTDDQLEQPAIPTTAITLLGLLRHLTDVERNWFAVHLDGQPDRPIYYDDDTDPNGDFDNLHSAAVADVWAAYDAAVTESRRITATFTYPEDLTRGSKGRPRNLRWILAHLLEEYARHNGHADLLREAIDGVTGE